MAVGKFVLEDPTGTGWLREQAQPQLGGHQNLGWGGDWGVGRVLSR